MKKSLIFSAVLLALGFVSCEDDDSTLGIPQVNPQETVYEAGGVAVADGSALAGGSVNLSDYKDKGIPVVNLVKAEGLPEGSSVYLEMELADNADYNNATTLAVTDGEVSEKEWDDWFRATMGRSPKARENYVRFAAYVDYQGQALRVGGEDTWFAAKKVSVTPVPMDFVIESEYYLIGTINNWGLNNEYPFKHSDKDVYDDPVFSITVEISEDQAAAGWWWKIAPASAVADSNWDAVGGTTVDGDSALEGKMLVGAGAQAGCIKQAGLFLLSINLEELTYTFKKLEYLYTPGDSNGWGFGDNNQAIAFNVDKNCYMGFAHLKGSFKFTSKANWDGTNYGAGDTAGTLSTDGGAGNLSVEEEGLYWCVIDVEKLTYTLTRITSMGAIGDMNGWGAQEPLTPSADFLTWSGDVTFGAGQGWKFRANDDWGINLGGSDTDLVYDGGNLDSPGAGTYTVTLDLSKLPYTCTTTAK